MNRARRTGPAVAAGMVVTAVTVVAVAAWPAGSGVPSAPHQPARTGPQGRVPQFVVECGWSHRAPDDPIVAPGHPGHSHLHDFFGSTITHADSTAESLRDGDTTCDTRQDTAAYWAPVLLDNGDPVQPARAIAYYRPGPGVDPTAIRPYPLGLAMVAGDPAATTQQSTQVIAWRCGAGARLHATAPTCSAAAPLSLHVVFPDCWNGHDLDSSDHRAHVTYSRDGSCPPEQSVPVPQLTLDIAYDHSGPSDSLTLSSGDLIGAHADFLNAWEPEKLATEVELCLQRGAVCGVASNRATG
jgi:hypothetical protein